MGFATCFFKEERICSVTEHQSEIVEILLVNPKLQLFISQTDTLLVKPACNVITILGIFVSFHACSPSSECGPIERHVPNIDRQLLVR